MPHPVYSALQGELDREMAKDFVKAIGVGVKLTWKPSDLNLSYE